MTKLYADRKPWELEPHYCAHVAAMTAEGLHEKSAIAAELAFRDKEIERQAAALRESQAEADRLRTENERLRDVLTQAARDNPRLKNALQVNP